jgi:hypothetical protein
MSQKNLFKLGSWCFSMVLLALLSLGQISQVEASAAYSFDSANFYGNGYYLPQTIGDVFTPTKNITVSSLGAFDYQQDGLREAHTVGIFNSSGTLLASAIISAGTSDSLVGAFRYASITPLTLFSGQTYTIAESLSSNADVIGYASTGKLSVDPDINFLPFSARYSIGMTGLQFPTGTSLASAEFYIGPNFDPDSDQIPDTPISGVPIPGAIWLLGSGLVGLAGRRRFRKG